MSEFKFVKAINLEKTKKRKILQWSLMPIMVITLAFGWWYPLLGFTVPVAMLTGMIGSFWNGRYVCGNLCPRGSFFDRPMRLISRKEAIPPFLRNMTFRWAIFAVLMGFMVYRVSLDPTNIYHWGRVFWVMCLVTTVLGIVLALTIHPRSWCSFCPVGTAGNSIGGTKNQLVLQSDICKECKLCEKACPMGLEIVKHKPEGAINNRDCLRCMECATKCPANAISVCNIKDAA